MNLNSQSSGSTPPFQHEPFFFALRQELKRRDNGFGDDPRWAELRQSIADFAEAYPAIRVDKARLVETLLTKHPAQGQQLAFDDLILVSALLAGDPAAFTLFERLLGREITKAARRLRHKGLDEADLRQRVGERLFVPDESGRAKISDYSGRGSLRAWLRVIVARAVIDHSRKRSGNESVVGKSSAVEVLSDRLEDPEMRYMKGLYRAEFAAAFERAFETLNLEEQSALRHRFVESLSIDQIATATGVHRATAARRVARAQESLIGKTRSELADKLELAPDELGSVMRLIESQLHVSVGRVFAQK